MDESHNLVKAFRTILLSFFVALDRGLTVIILIPKEREKIARNAHIKF